MVEGSREAEESNSTTGGKPWEESEAGRAAIVTCSRCLCYGRSFFEICRWLIIFTRTYIATNDPLTFTLSFDHVFPPTLDSLSLICPQFRFSCFLSPVTYNNYIYVYELRK